MGKLIIVSSVSGAGKTTLVDKASIEYGLYKLKTCTTRHVRPEENGDEYYFFAVDEFLDNIDSNGFFEHAKVYGNHYGLLNSEIKKSEERNCIAILDVQGAETARAMYTDAITVFIEPPSRSELELRILKRNTGKTDATRRMYEFDSEMEQMKYFTHTVKYDTLSTMTNEFNQIIKSILD